MTCHTYHHLIAEALGFGLVDYAADVALEAASFGMLGQDAARSVADYSGCPERFRDWWRVWAASRGARP